MIKHISILLLIFLLHNVSYAQDKRIITGKVTDANTNEALYGATVVVKGSFNGVSTNINGEFTMELSGNDLPNLLIEVSFVGYKPTSIQASTQNYFEFKLTEDVNSLNELVITSSYGTKKLKQEVVGSISSISAKDLVVETPATSFDQLLEGATAGVYIEPNSNPGKPIEIHVRGQGSLTPLSANNVGTSTQPLIIVDGIILAEEITLDGNNFFDAGEGVYSESLMNPLSKIGITDIESINILKDAAAVSLYGADGANGVILVSTKRGQKGKPKVNFSTQGGINTAINRIEYLNGEQFQEMRNLYYYNSGQYNNISEWNGVNTNWFDLLNRTGSFQNYDLSISGGSNHLTYRASLGHSNIQEPQINNNFKKYNGSFSIAYKRNKWNASIKISPSLVTKNSPNTLFAFALPPTISPYDELGEYSHFETYGNPLAVANQNRALVETQALLNSTSLTYFINKHLNVSTLLGLDFSNKNQDTYFSGLNDTGVDNNGNIGNRMIRTHDTRRWNWNAKALYENQLNATHFFDALLGIETHGNSVNYTYAKGENFPLAGEIMPIDKAEKQDYESDKQSSTGRSLFSQANYNFRKKYFVLANFRVDQSSSFGTDNNTSYNGGLGLSWNISKENFLKNQQWINFLRVRASYGTSGNSRIGSYSALGLYTFNDVGNNGYNRGDFAKPSTAPNPNLGWEKNYKFNLGLDFATTWRLSTTIDLFHDNIQDMIVSRNTLPESGYDNVQINGANMFNKGIEVSVNYGIISTSKFKWTTSFNFSYIKNKVTFLKGLGSKYSTSERASAQRIGYSTSVIWGYNFLGVDPATGRDLYSIDYSIIDAKVLKENYGENINWKPIGNTQPDVYGGVSNKFKLGKHLDLSIHMSYSFGADVLVSKELIDHYVLLYNRNLTANSYNGSWKKVGDIANYPAINKSNPLVSNSSKYLYSTSHIKLRSVNLSYSIPLKKNTVIDKISVYSNGSNLFYWFMEKTPEGLNGVAELRFLYPEMRTFSFGLNATF